MIKPGDHDLTEERWQEVAELRLSALGRAFDAMKDAAGMGWEANR